MQENEMRNALAALGFQMYNTQWEWNEIILLLKRFAQAKNDFKMSNTRYPIYNVLNYSNV